MYQSNQMNYISGVPVKIAENYKPPKKIALSTSITQRLSNATAATSSHSTQSPTFDHDFSLEKTVLSKMSEWKDYREQTNVQRIERIRLREKERTKKLEERQKKMLTDVSYPSADDLSSDEEEKNLKPTSQSNSIATATQQQKQLNALCFNKILIPTVMPGQSKRIGGNSTTNLSKINYSDFESDDPFDNIELKTINDLDILAQILQTTNVNKETTNKINQANCDGETSVIPTATETTSVTAPSIPLCNGNNQVSPINTSATTNAFNVLHSQHYQHSQQPNIDATQQMTHLNRHIHSTTMNHNNSTVVGMAHVYTNATHLSEPNKRSSNDYNKMPDILREINAELRNLERRREQKNDVTNENVSRNQCQSPSMATRSKSTTEEIKQYQNLTTSTQALVSSISKMGFPIERVARITEKIGENDKKVCRYSILIILIVH